jgi:uncharacterized protein YjbJ (UPF0337 family)
MGQNGYQVDLGALDQAAKGVKSATDALTAQIPGGMGQYTSAGQAGELLNALHLSDGELGDPGLADVWKGFLNRRSWDLRTRLKEGEQMVGHLQDSRTAYQKTEDDVSGILKTVVGNVAGNPMDTKPASQKSWGEIGQEMGSDKDPSVGQAVGTVEQNAGSVVNDSSERLRDPASYVPVAGQAVETVRDWNQG